jgi:hypothetical protein
MVHLKFYNPTTLNGIDWLMLTLNISDSTSALRWDHSLVNLTFIWHQWILTCLHMMVFNHVSFFISFERWIFMSS